MDGFRGSYFAGSARPRGEFPVGPRAVGGRNTSQRVHHSPLGPRNYLIHTAVSSYSHPIRAAEKRFLTTEYYPVVTRYYATRTTRANAGHGRARCPHYSPARSGQAQAIQPRTGRRQAHFRLLDLKAADGVPQNGTIRGGWRPCTVAPVVSNGRAIPPDHSAVERDRHRRRFSS